MERLFSSKAGLSSSSKASNDAVNDISNLATILVVPAMLVLVISTFPRASRLAPLSFILIMAVSTTTSFSLSKVFVEVTFADRSFDLIL